VPISRGSPIPLYLQIEEELRQQVDSGHLQALQQVPSEVALAEDLGVSRMTARKALDKMVADGILFRRAGKGTYVAAPKIAHIASQQLSFSASMQALGLRHSTVVLSAGIADPSATVYAQLRLSPRERVIAIRRLRIVEDVPAAIHLAYLPERFSSLLQHDLTGSLTALMAAVGAVVVVADDTLEAVQAASEEAHLLKVKTNCPLIKIDGTAYGQGGQPLRWSEGVYRSDRFRFRVDGAAPREHLLGLEIK
jgi:GntR family transcriptional regulator